MNWKLCVFKVLPPLDDRMKFSMSNSVYRVGLWYSLLATLLLPSFFSQFDYMYLFFLCISKWYQFYERLRDINFWVYVWFVGDFLNMFRWNLQNGSNCDLELYIHWVEWKLLIAPEFLLCASTSVNKNQILKLYWPKLMHFFYFEFYTDIHVLPDTYVYNNRVDTCTYAISGNICKYDLSKFQP